MKIKSLICALAFFGLLASHVSAAEPLPLSEQDAVLRALLIDDYREFLRGSHQYFMKWDKSPYDPTVTYTVHDVMSAYIHNEVAASAQFKPYFNLSGEVLRVGMNDQGNAYAIFLTALEAVHFRAYVEQPLLLAEHEVGSGFKMVCADFQRIEQDIAVNCFDPKQFALDRIRLAFERPDLEYFSKYSLGVEHWSNVRQFAQKIEQSPIRADFVACISKRSDCYDMVEQLP